MMKLSEEQIIIRLQSIKHHFSYSQGRLIAEFKFLDFSEAFVFLTKIALVASRLNHYPSLVLEENRVKISLYTSAFSGLTEKDFLLAAEIMAMH